MWPQVFVEELPPKNIHSDQEKHQIADSTEETKRYQIILAFRSGQHELCPVPWDVFVARKAGLVSLS